MSAITTVMLKDAEYDCECGLTHRYSDGEIFQLHHDMRIDRRRWIYEEVEA